MTELPSERTMLTTSDGRWMITVPRIHPRKRWRKKMVLLFKAHTLLYIADWLFDNVLYVFVLAVCGVFVGLLIMTVLSIVFCLTLLMYYIKSDEDWLGVDVVEDVKENGDAWIRKLYSKRTRWWNSIVRVLGYIPTQIFRLVLWLLRKNDIAAFLALSIYEDAFRTTAFLRHGRKGPMNNRDWGIFLASIVVSNVWWTLRWSIIIEVVRKLLW